MTAYSEEDIKKRLELTLFIGFDRTDGQSDSKEHIPEKLLYHQLVSEEKVKSNTLLSKKQNHQHHSKEDDQSEDDDNNANLSVNAHAKLDQKQTHHDQQLDQKSEMQRCICLTSRLIFTSSLNSIMSPFISLFIA